MERITVVGAGAMGAGIAQVATQAGFGVTLLDVDEAAVAAGLGRVEADWQRGVDRGKLTSDDAASWRDRLATAADLPAAVEGADLVIEAVPENLDLKRGLLARIDAAAPPDTLIASNTSGLSISALAAATRRPGQVLGMHFFNPVPRMRLLELVRHEGTSQEALAAARRVGEAMGKTCITVQDSPGFATTRLGIVLGNEATRMLEEGIASARDIDAAMVLGFGHPMGPLELGDLVGHDVRLAVCEDLSARLGGPQFEAPALTRRLVAAGDLGQKTGRGVYDWSTGKPEPRELP